MKKNKKNKKNIFKSKQHIKNEKISKQPLKAVTMRLG